MLTQTGVDMIMGVFSSAHCVPLATKVDPAKKFFLINTCISPAVLQDRHLRSVFRPQVHRGQFVAMSPDIFAPFPQTNLAKIGSASRRDRVCPLLFIPVLAYSLI